jgi:quercetin dioxygenase-like cupin family protein
MNARRRYGLLILALALAGAMVVRRAASAAATQAKAERARVAFSHDLPRLNGETLSATIVEVNYGPGESSGPHTHPCPVIGYVLQGAIRTQVKGEPESIYKQGQSFYEAPNGVHLVSANASATEPARLLAYFVCDHHAPLSMEIAEKQPTEKN